MNEDQTNSPVPQDPQNSQDSAVDPDQAALDAARAAVANNPAPEIEIPSTNEISQPSTQPETLAGPAPESAPVAGEPVIPDGDLDQAGLDALAEAAKNNPEAGIDIPPAPSSDPNPPIQAV